MKWSKVHPVRAALALAVGYIVYVLGDLARTDGDMGVRMAAITALVAIGMTIVNHYYKGKDSD